MADSMNATLSDPTFEKKEDLNAPVSNPANIYITQKKQLR